MTRYARKLTRRTLILSLLTLAAFKKLAGLGRGAAQKSDKETIVSGGWLLKKSDLS